MTVNEADMTRIDGWCEEQRRLLLLERDAEREQLSDKLSSLSPSECQELGLSLLSLQVESSFTSLYGRVKYHIQRRDKKELPTHSFKAGDEAELYSARRKSAAVDSSIVSGIISRVSATFIEMVCEDGDETDLVPPLRLDLRSSEATHTKLMHALNDLGNISESPAWPLVDLLFGEVPLPEDPVVPISPFNSKLNESQIQAIEYALSASRLSLIHGPPGTGKTTAVVELILQAVRKGQKLLVCAPSNVAIDNILERLVNLSETAQNDGSSHVNIVRLGHPARMSDAVHRHCLDALVSADEGTEIVHDVRRDIDQARRQLMKVKSKKDKDKNRMRELQVDIRALRKEVRQREDKVIKGIISSRNVVMCTCVGASSRLLRGCEFDAVVIDEAAQALEASCWIPMLHSAKVILAGDHCQLPPTIKSTEAERSGLAVTLFERIVKNERLKICSHLLDIQYRMNREISDWASRAMYHGRLRPHESNSAHSLFDLKLSTPQSKCGGSAVQPSSEVSSHLGDPDLDELSKTIMLLVDTAGCNMEEESARGGSHRNPQEAEIVVAHVHQLYKLGLRPDQIGVITPYNGQIEVLREMFASKADTVCATGDGADNVIAKDKGSGLEIRTVDGFQGGEKEAIILSLVRSNPNREVGFLAENRRINVAVTRAKRHLAVVCDTDTCSNDKFIGHLLSHVSERGDHRSAVEYMQSIQPIPLPTIPDEVVWENVSALPPPLQSNDDSVASVAPTTAVKNPKKQPKAVAPFVGTKKKPQSKENKKSPLVSASHEPPIVPSTVEQKDIFASHIRNMLLYLATRRLEGGIIGTGAARILCSNTSALMSFRSDTGSNASDVSVNDEDCEAPVKARLNLYSSLITPNPNMKSNVPSHTRPSAEHLVFPSKLTSHQRLVIHTVAEEINSMPDSLVGDTRGLLLHSSEGENESRRIEVKVVFPSNKTDASGGLENVTGKDLDHENIYGEISSDSDDGISIHEKGEVSIETPDLSRKQNSKPKKKPKKKKSSTGSQEEKIVAHCRSDMSEMELLDAAIKSNEDYSEYRKYRVASVPMPNYDKVKAAESLRRQISQSQNARAGESKSKESDAKKSSSSRKKIVKKPPRNFGGGRLGGS